MAGKDKSLERDREKSRKLRALRLIDIIMILVLKGFQISTPHQVIHLETCVARELKRRREAAAERENKKAGERSGDKRGKTPSSSSARKTPRHTPGKTPGKKVAMIMKGCLMINILESGNFPEQIP